MCIYVCRYVYQNLGQYWVDRWDWVVLTRHTSISNVVGIVLGNGFIKTHLLKSSTIESNKTYFYIYHLLYTFINVHAYIHIKHNNTYIHH